MKSGIRARYWLSGASVLWGVALAAQGCTVGDLRIVRGTLGRDGGAASGDSGVPSAIPRDRFFTELAAVLCESTAPCCAAANRPFDARECEQQIVANSATSPLTKATNYDGWEAALCLDAYRNAARGCFSAMDLSACDRIAVTPRGAAGDPCDSTCEQTSSGIDSCAGVTIVRPCHREDGVYCDFRGSRSVASGACRAMGTVGSSCADSQGCEGSWCNNGTCAAFLGTGEPCQQLDSCRDGYCAAGSCVPDLPNGASCATGGGASCASGFCDALRKECADQSTSVLLQTACVVPGGSPPKTGAASDTGVLPSASDSGPPGSGVGTFDSGASLCGDGRVEVPLEQCDGVDVGGQTCATVTMGAFPTGTLTCRTDCRFDTSGCHTP